MRSLMNCRGRALRVIHGKNDDKIATPTMGKRTISSARLVFNQLTESDGSNETIMPPKEELQFGKTFAPHMLQIHYKKSSGGWEAPAIVPFQDLKLSPAASALHYGEKKR